ncbi:hypothetical protein [Agromyces indicus]|uniref:Uncharacterized protein n=1 Tax=Agromyces indicus TaxID=758919 RepID=A0ABU1FM31_9MICO|nr:hypothetical protein [Agromyces indicus]MDR5692822.1 hypothetical protein [Agromyces indicus]
MDRIILTVVLVGGYLALVVAANVEAPAPQQATAAAFVASPATADAAEYWSAAAGGTGASLTADAAERTLTSSFDRLPKPSAPR